jgi:DNA-binding protein HU-beta
MTKSELVEAIAKEAGLSKADSERALNAFTDTVKKSLKKGNAVTMVGFGTFDISKRKARMGRNPQTGEAIKIAAATLPKFKAGKGLKDAVKKK